MSATQHALPSTATSSLPDTVSAASPLAGLLVVDLSRVLAGPYCTMVLRDLGARVLKVERPGAGDDARHFPPFIPETGDSGYFITVNRGKESLAIDFASTAGRDALLGLLDRADVLVENFSPGTLERHSLGPEALLGRNPRLIVARLSGYGQTGPDCDLPAYDITVQARSGLMAMTGPEGGGPVKVGSAISDIGGGLYCALGILAALHERSRSGQGQVVDISMLDASIALLENSVVRRSIGGTVPVPIGQRHPSITPFDGFRCADGTIVIGAGNDAIFRRLAAALGMPLWADNPRFATNEARTANQRELKALIEAILETRAISHWLGVLRGAEVPCAEIQSIDQVIADPQVAARKLITEFDHPASGRRFPIVASPFQHFSRTPGASACVSPGLGEHTASALAELLGYSPEEIAQVGGSGRR